MADDAKTPPKSDLLNPPAASDKAGAGLASPPTPKEPTDKERMALLERAVIMQARGSSVGPTPGLDQTVPGGRYRFVLPDGSEEWKNADGEVLNDDGSLKYPGQQVKDAFGRLTTVRR